MSKTDPRARLQSEIRRAEQKLENLKEQARKARAAVNFAKADEINEKILILQSELKGMQAELEAMQAAAGDDPAATDGNARPAPAAAPTIDEKRKTLDESLKDGTISVEDYMNATGLTDEDTGPIGNGLLQQADRIAKERSPYHQAINKIYEALSDQMRKAMDAPASTPQQRKAKQERVARITRDRETLDMIARNFEHPFQNAYVTKLSPNLRERFENLFSKIQTGPRARDAFRNDSYSAWADLLIEVANKKQAEKTEENTGSAYLPLTEPAIQGG